MKNTVVYRKGAMAFPEKNEALVRFSSNSGRQVFVVTENPTMVGTFDVEYSVSEFLVDNADPLPALNVRICCVEISSGVARAALNVGRKWLSEFPQVSELQLVVGLQRRGVRIAVAPPDTTGMMECALAFSGSTATIGIHILTDLSCVSELLDGLERLS